MEPQYHKIITVYKRNPQNMRFLLDGRWAIPEFEYLQNNTWVFTEKVDGTNIRIMWNGKSVEIAGKSDNASIPPFLLNKLNNMFMTIEIKRMFSDMFGNECSVCLYGEGYGNKIQKAGKLYKADDTDFVLFDVLINGMWLERHNVEDIAVKLGIKVVPIIGTGSLNEAIELVKKGFDSQWGEFQAEGIVARPQVELKDRRGNRIITKIKCRDFQ